MNNRSAIVAVAALACSFLLAGYLRVDNYNMGSDPLPGARKWLRILYSYEGERRNVTVPEKSALQLP